MTDHVVNEAVSAGPNETLLNHIESFSRFGPTVRATTHAVFAALFVPLIFWLILWQLSPNYEASSLRGSVMRSMWLCLPMLFSGLVLLKALKQGGVAETHYNWSPKLCCGLRRAIGWMVLLCIPLQFLYTSLETFDSGVYFDTLGRFFFVASMAVFATGLWFASIQISTWMEGDTASSNTPSSAGFWRLMFLRLSIGIPTALALMACTGYYFTAVRLSWRMFWTVLFSIGIAMAAALASRLLLITQFRIKLRQLTRDDEGRIDSGESIDILEISSQVNRLLRVTAIVSMVVAAWYVWGSVIPSSGLFETGLWRSATALTDSGGEYAWVTIRHLLMAAGLLVITFVLSRNLPGLLEITLLDRLPLDRGGRYAISFVVRYMVGVAGLLTTFHLLGFSWTSVQWLAAGLSVGLGFGLQEIFANLISGIIILIERPVRVGDVVTVNNVTGTVTRMELRATTIRDLDHRELIVPNKKFITEDVMNWTLSDRLSRLTFQIGVAYGSDTELVQSTLLDVARQSPLVLNDPPPQVVFQCFGSSTLDFELRVVIPSRDNFADVQHELNMIIDRAFREKNIEIAFPQQDLHVRSLDGVAVKIGDNSSSVAATEKRKAG
ncbi:MAG: mechanosensitive ion channel domain-containing protein [Planctomycetota bacterium]